MGIVKFGASQNRGLFKIGTSRQNSIYAKLKQSLKKFTIRKNYKVSYWNRKQKKIHLELVQTKLIYVRNIMFYNDIQTLCCNIIQLIQI